MIFEVECLGFSAVENEVGLDVERPQSGEVVYCYAWIQVRIYK
jgi:hypothetical protein